MVVPLAVLFSAALLAISLFAKSYREAQSYLSPLTIVVMLPAVVSVLPGVELNAGLSLIPVLNTSLVSKEIVSGTYHWGFIALIFGSSCVYAALALWVATRSSRKRACFFARKAFDLQCPGSSRYTSSFSAPILMLSVRGTGRAPRPWLPAAVSTSNPVPPHSRQSLTALPLPITRSRVRTSRSSSRNSASRRPRSSATCAEWLH